ncbi:hypothetical protein QIA01_04855 (plasmid) [Borreliella americana]
MQIEVNIAVIMLSLTLLHYLTIISNLFDNKNLIPASCYWFGLGLACMNKKKEKN